MKPTTSAPIPAGRTAQPNGYGVEILSGASENTIGGATAVAGNVIAFNSAPGVDVEGSSSIGNQITSNRIFGNDDSSAPSPVGALQFDGSNYVSLPNGLIDGSEPSETLEARFQTTSGGVILGYQSASPGIYPGNGWVPTLYVGTDGKLYGGSYVTQYNQIFQITSNTTVNDGHWHDVALVVDGAGQSMTLYLDGQLVGVTFGSFQYLADSFNQIGTGYTDGWPATPGGWYGFAGQIADVRVWSEALSAAQISQDVSTAPAATAPGLEADYPLNDGQGQTAVDLTSNQNSSAPAGALQFDGSNYVSLPNNLISGAEQEETIEASFETTSGGVILGNQTTDPSTIPAAGYVPAIYVGTDGRLYGEWSGFPLLTSTATVADGRWHQVALVADSQSGTLNLYLDGLLAGSSSGSASDFGGSFNQIGTGYTANYYPNTKGGWYGFSGQIADVRIWSVARTAGQVQQDMTTPPAATAPGLEADYPLNDGQGQTAFDLTSNHDDGTLAAINGNLPTWVIGTGSFANFDDGTLAAISGNLPTWVIGSGEAIDLGGDGITYNSSAPRQGPNNLQNYPVVVSTADDGFEGWLGGSMPDTTYRIDVFASAGYSPQGAGQAQDFLGSLDVTTDGQGQAIFDVPFTPPAGLPVVTATATDPEGNTSEVSTQLTESLEAPTQYVHIASGQALVFSSSQGDGIALQDPAAGPLDPAWDVTLSVTAGTLTLSSLSGLVGSGDGTGTLQYQGSLSALNAALEGMIYSQAAGTHGNFTLSLTANAVGLPALAAQVILTDGFFSVTTTADSGPGSLRQAIINSNTETGGTNTIGFAIPGQGVQTISPLSPLPAITNPVLIDGFSQPGYAGTPLIELSGSQAGIADGLTITGSGVTVRGLDINGFAEGAGILISGASATGNTIEVDDIGTDPSGLAALPNDFGVQISGGASDNLVGGNTAALGNLIAFNFGPGVEVLGTSTVGNQITADRIFANDASPTPSPAGALQFDGSNYVSLPNGLIDGSEPSETLEAWFQTTGGGVILGYQSSSAGGLHPSGYVPSLYVGTDGKLYGGSYDTTLGAIEQVTSNVAVNDGQWHNVAFVVDGATGTMTLYLDGQLVGSVSGSPQSLADSFNQVGTGYTGGWPATPGGWYGFVGQIDDVRVWSGGAIGRRNQPGHDDARPTAPNRAWRLTITFDDGQGLTASDQTPNDNDGTLAGLNGDLPTWVFGSGQAIALGSDGNHLQLQCTSPGTEQPSELPDHHHDG